jgi:hypothetical protein
MKFIRRYYREELAQFFDEELLQRAGEPVDDMFACIYMLWHDDAEETSDHILMDGAEVSKMNVSYGFKVINYLIEMNQIKISSDMMMETSDFVEFDDKPYDYHVHPIFLTSQHPDGQAKLTCGALETLVNIDVSNTGKIIVAGSASETDNTGNAYPIMAYIADLMEKTNVIECYDLFENNVDYKIGNVQVKHFQQCAPEVAENENLINDIYVHQYENSEPKGKVYNIKKICDTNLVDGKIMLRQPFMNDREYRLTSYIPIVPYRDTICFVTGTGVCYDCSYVQKLIMRIMARIPAARDPRFADRVRAALMSWIYGAFNIEKGHINKRDRMLYRLFTYMRRKGKIVCDDHTHPIVIQHGIEVYFQYLRERVRVRGVTDRFPEWLLYSKIVHSYWNHSLSFVPAIERKRNYSLKLLNFLGITAEEYYVFCLDEYVMGNNNYFSYSACVVQGAENVYFQSLGVVPQQSRVVYLTSEKDRKLDVSLQYVLKIGVKKLADKYKLQRYVVVPYSEEADYYVWIYAMTPANMKIPAVVWDSVSQVARLQLLEYGCYFDQDEYEQFFKVNEIQGI